jgi:hypothetical protein
LLEVALSQTGWTDLVERFFREAHRCEVVLGQTGRLKYVERSLRFVSSFAARET